MGEVRGVFLSGEPCKKVISPNLLVYYLGYLGCHLGTKLYFIEWSVSLRLFDY